MWRSFTSYFLRNIVSLFADIFTKTPPCIVGLNICSFNLILHFKDRNRVHRVETYWKFWGVSPLWIFPYMYYSAFYKRLDLNYLCEKIMNWYFKKWKWSRNRYLTWSWRHADMYFVIYLYFCSCLTQHWLVVQIIYGVLCFLCMILCIHSLFRNLKTHSIQMTLLALVLNMLPYYFTTQFYLLRNQYHSKKREKGKLFFMSHLWNTA